jgi:hypothetical protein
MVQRRGLHATIKSIVLVRKRNLLPICHIFSSVALQIEGNGLPAAPQGDLGPITCDTESRGTTRAGAHRDPRANALLVATLRAARLLHRLSDPVSRVGS